MCLQLQFNAATLHKLCTNRALETLSFNQLEGRETDDIEHERS